MTIFFMYFYYSTQRFVIEFRRLENTFYFHFLKSASMSNTYGYELVVPELQASQKSTLSVLSINDVECLSASPLYSRQYTKMAGSSHQTWSILKQASAISGVKSFRNSTTLHRFLIFLCSWLLSSLITFQFMVISH